MKVLIAEDEFFFRCLMESTLGEWGYEVVSVADGDAAWAVLQRPDAPKLAILDWQMPGVDGLELCRRIRASNAPEPTYVIMLTSREGRANTLEALRAGADDYVTKPFDREELQVRLQAGVRIVGLQTSLAVIYSLVRAVEAKSPYTHGHAERVTGYALQLGHRAALSEKQLTVLRQGSILHDIGKIAVPDAILDKTEVLTPEEFTVMKRHTVDGVRLISPLQSLHAVVPLVRWHHERLDGSGYPDGLRGDEIPLLVRILSIADVYDALRSTRPYREALPQSDCFAILREEARRSRLDAGLVGLFVEAVKDPVAVTVPTPADALKADSNLVA